ncbi:serine hydrolase [Arthrobacter sp. MYb229]|uniref:serine hydrolase domain-containing protein n=1 Tax=unclassified Arthrobacter TaxID=235627 RepID=UPI000CFCBA9E|nr:MULTISPECIES: serine hydrolase domain-containing protein [unclassified Arthrobacter]PRA06944.1 serine hydrolase [Arthrobacter sp. MYb229]PRB47892.1 serine hydrolase [Arthrobacter sp. MYb216]
MSVLAEIEQWPADNAVSVVVNRDGAISDQHGDIQRVYPLASVTKLLSTYAFLIALEEEAMTLEDPAGPEGSTVHHLLAHTAGYDFDSTTIRFAVGTKRGYSNTGFEVLAEHLERETGMRMSEYAREAVFAPLGMENTEIAGSCAKDGRSTASDLALFAAELLNPTLLAPQTMADATSVHYEDLAGILPGYGRQNPNDWGLGFEIRSTKNPHWTGPSHPATTFGHFGQSGTFLWVDPENRLACVALTDKPFGQWAVDAWAPYNERVLCASRKQ